MKHGMKVPKYRPKQRKVAKPAKKAGYAGLRRALKRYG